MTSPSLKEYEMMAGNPVSCSPKPQLALDIEAAMAKDLEELDPVLSPKSPSSIFGKSVIEKSKGCIITTALLSYWDNILGPRIKHQWCTEGNNTAIKTDTLSYVASHTLSGEICRNMADSDIDTVFCVVKDRDIVVTSFIFGAVDNGEMAVHSLSLIVQYSHLKTFLGIQELCVEWNKRLTGRLRVLMEKESKDTMITCFSGYLTKFIQMLNCLRESGLPKHIPLCDSAFHPHNKLSKSLLRRAITSHLLTCGRTVVIGDSTPRINLMLATLAMFLSPAERACCCYAVEDRQLVYQPDLLLQGIVHSSEQSELCDSLQDLYLSSYPSSLVDVHSGLVKLSGLVHQHIPRCQEAQTKELQTLWQGQFGQDYPTSDMFHTYDDPETLVTNFVDELFLLPATNGLRESFIRQFVAVLERKAISLLKYVKAEMLNRKGTRKDLVKKMHNSLALTVPGDFNIVLASAEKLQPGIAEYLCGDKRTDVQFRQYLEKIK